MQQVMENLERIRYLILDVDGTMTDGGVYLGSRGEEMKRFSIKDGAGIMLARQAGIESVILTGRESRCVQRRAGELSISLVFQGVKDKRAFLLDFLETNDILPQEAAYMGDDLNDLEAMQCVGLAVCPQDAAKQVKAYCPIVLSAKGGEGAVREFVEMILEKRGIQYEGLVL